MFKILDPERTRVEFNSRWLSPLGAEGMIRLAARYNVAQMLERREFKQRYEAGQPIAVHEFLYPLAQAYDSVALEADVELGGTDQLFNLNVGRDIMPGFGLAPQIVMTTPLLEGLDGVEKMSKSLGNYIGVTDAPNDMFGKVMSISDALMWKYYALLTDVGDAAPRGIAGSGRRGHASSRARRRSIWRAASSPTSTTRSAAARAAAEFDRVHAQGALPTDLRDVPIVFDARGRRSRSRGCSWMPGSRPPRARRGGRCSRAA